MAAQNPQVPQTPQKKYAKGSAWKWILLYVVLAIIVYGLVYYIFFKDSGGGNDLTY